MNLFYNCYHPVNIVKELKIKCSWINQRNRGVSFSEQIINSHGPFTLCFAESCDFYKQFIQVQYGQFEQYDFTRKNDCFAGEFEWWSEQDVLFKPEDLVQIIFRKKSPGFRLQPRKCEKIFSELKRVFPRVVLGESLVPNGESG